MESRTLIPFVGSMSVAPAEQSAYIQAMIEAAQIAQKIGWGADGTITGVVEEVRSQRLWLDPNFPVLFSDDALQSAKRALLTTGQQSPIHVVKLENPAAQQRSHDGTTDKDLLIVDIDGALVFMAAAGTSIDEFRVMVEPYDGSYYQLLLRMVSRKAQQHKLRRVEKGRCYLRAKDAYEAEQAWRTQQGQSPLRRFPGLKELAPQFDCVSEADMSLCVAIADFDEETLQLADGKKLTDDQLRELVSVPADKRLALARQLAYQQELIGKTLPREEVRQQIKLVAGKPPKPAIRWESVTRPVVVSGFWTRNTAQEEVPAPVALGCLMHDVAYCLDATEKDLPKEAQGLVKKLRAILADPAMQDLIAGVQADEEIA